MKASPPIGGTATRSTAATRSKETDKTLTSSAPSKADKANAVYKTGAGLPPKPVMIASKAGGTQMRSTGTARPAAAAMPAAAKGKTSRMSVAVSKPTTKDALGSPGKTAAQGHAHRLYMGYAKDNKLLKRQLHTMMTALQQQGKFKFASEEKLQGFVDREFAKHDVNGNGKLNFEEFFEFYCRWLDENAREQVDVHQMQTCPVETAFMRYDTDHDFNLTAAELRVLIMDMQPVGQPKPPDRELQACVDDIMATNDLNANGGISFEEFSSGYNMLLARVDALHKAQRRKVMESQAGFRSMMREETDQEKLEQATKAQFDGCLWVASEHQMTHAESLAARAGKIALFLDAPPGELDLPTARYSAKMGAHCKVLDIQALVMGIADRSATDDEVCSKVRDTVLECMRNGAQLLLRLGRTAPDFMGSWNRKDLPLDFFLPENAEPGPLKPALHKMVQPPLKCSSFVVAEGYRLVLTSCFNMNDFHGFLRSKLPLHGIQPIQVMPDLAEVAEVLEYGLPKSGDDDAFAEMDRLADML